MDLKQKYTMESKLIDIINNEYGLDILESTRDKYRVEARVIFSKIMKSQCNYGYTKIGRVLHKNHATIIYYIKIFDDWFDYDQLFRDRYLKILDVYSSRAELKDINTANKLIYDNVVLEGKIKKLEKTLNRRLHRLISEVPDNKEELIFDRLLVIMKMNC